MTIFVEKALVQLKAQALEDLSCHSKLNYAAVVFNESYGTLYIFQEV